MLGSSTATMPALSPVEESDLDTALIQTYPKQALPTTRYPHE